MNFLSFKPLGWLLLGCALSACGHVSAVAVTEPRSVVTLDNQTGIYNEGMALYRSGSFRPAVDLFQMAYDLRPADRIQLNLGMAYLKLAQQKYPGILRLEYTRRALTHLKSYRLWLTTDYGRSHSVAAPLFETNQRISEAQRLEKELRTVYDRP